MAAVAVLAIIAVVALSDGGASSLAVNGAGKLSPSEVRTAWHGFGAILQLCAAEGLGDETSAQIEAALQGEPALQTALQTDPNTLYRDVLGPGPAMTMRGLALTLLADGPDGRACGGIAQELETALAAMP